MNRFLFYLLLIFSIVVQAAQASQWTVDHARSEITFVAITDNAPFKGEFKQFWARLQFNEAEQTKSQLRISIDLASIDTQSEDGDALLIGSEFFNTRHWPEASFSSESIEKEPDGLYLCIGVLTIRNIQQKVRVVFSFQKQMQAENAVIVLQGTLHIDRLDFDVGLGDWINTDWVANEVEINFTLGLMPVAAHKP